MIGPTGVSLLSEKGKVEKFARIAAVALLLCRQQLLEM